LLAALRSASERDFDPRCREAVVGVLASSRAAISNPPDGGRRERGQRSPPSAVRLDAQGPRLRPCRDVRALELLPQLPSTPTLSVTIRGMPLAREQRKLAAIIAADVVGYSR